MTNPVGLCTVAFKERSVREIAEMAAAAGADGLEIWGQPPHIGYPIDSVQCRRVRETVASHGLTICALGSYFQPGKTISFAGVMPDPENQIRLADLLGTKVIRIWAGTANYDDASPEERESVCEAIGDFADAAHKEGMSVVLERHNSSLTNSWTSPAAVLETIARSNVHLNYQVPHPVRPEELAAGAVDDYRRYLKDSAHAHVQNYRARHGETESPIRCYLDEGVADYSGLGDAAAEAGYNGYFMVEFLPDDLEGLTPVEALRRDIDYLSRCLS